MVEQHVKLVQQEYQMQSLSADLGKQSFQSKGAKVVVTTDLECLSQR